jgi:hypothetical protein
VAMSCIELPSFNLFHHSIRTWPISPCLARRLGVWLGHPVSSWEQALENLDNCFSMVWFLFVQLAHVFVLLGSYSVICVDMLRVSYHTATTGWMSLYSAQNCGIMKQIPMYVSLFAYSHF